MVQYRRKTVPYYPKEIFNQEQIEKYFCDSSLLQLRPQKPIMTKTNSVSFNLDSANLQSNTDERSPNYHITSLE